MRVWSCFCSWGLLLVVILRTNTKINVWRPVRRIEVLTALTYLAFSTWFGEYLNVPEIICSRQKSTALKLIVLRNANKNMVSCKID